MLAVNDSLVLALRVDKSPTQLTGPQRRGAPLGTLAGGVLPGELSWAESAGRGESAQVFRAVDARGRSFAVKVGLGASHAEILATEASCLASSSAPSLPRLWGGGRLAQATSFDERLSEGLPFLVLDWLGGGSLRSAWNEREPLSLAPPLLRDVSEALVELHAAGLGHGDLKPDNLMLSEDAERVVLVDFGLSGDANAATPTGGTLRYLAPEVLQVDNAPGRAVASDARARDLYALGLTLVELLRPELREVSDLREAARAARLPEPYERLVRPLLAQHPADRPSASWLLGQVESEWPGAPDAEIMARQRAVRRAYLAVRGGEVQESARAQSTSIDVQGAPRTWLEEASRGASIARAVRGLSRASGTAELKDLTRDAQRRFVVRAVGPSAAAWPSAWGSDADLVARMLDLATSRGLYAITRSALLGERETEISFGNAELRTQAALLDPVRLALCFAELPLDPAVLHAVERLAEAPEPLALAAARALRLRGEFGRARVLLDRLTSDESRLELALVLRRSGAGSEARALLECIEPASLAPELRATRAALLARDALDRGGLDEAESLLDRAAPTAATLEVRALVELSRGRAEGARDVRVNARSLATNDEQQARLWGVSGLVAHAEARPDQAFEAFQRAAEHAERAGALLEEATYLTGVAAAATNRGALEVALSAAERATLLFEYLGRDKEAARAALARAAVFAVIGAEVELRTAAADALRRARAEGDTACQGYVHLALCDGLSASPREAAEHAQRAHHFLATGSDEDKLRAGARLMSYAHELDVVPLDALAREDVSPEAKLDWWGARARSFAQGRGVGRAEDVLEALLTLANLGAAGIARGPALVRGAELALGVGRAADARRLLASAREAFVELSRGTPGALRRHVDALEWASLAQAPAESSLAPEQLDEVDALVRSLGARDRLKPLLEQVLDALLLWTGVERGLLLLRAPRGSSEDSGRERLAVRAARNLGREDLRGEQLELSQSLALRALEKGEPVVAVDAAGELPDLHRSVHALRLRSVLAVPLIARGETQGVVYLDDRSRRGAFGARELAWVRLVATLAAVAIADARDQLRLRRAARRAERAEARIARTLSRREAELEIVTRELGRSQGGRETRGDYSGIVGRSSALSDMLAVVDRVSASEVPVLVIGESGSGKELVARALHDNGPRAGKSFVAENCAAIPETLLESTLFGHVRGAFTGASRQRVGLFEVADGGTLFLDEIGEMSLAMQTKLLRAVQEGEIRPVGSERPRPVNVRVIAATHRDLKQRVSAGLFREDLYYRLNVISVKVPPLRERPGDIQLLVQHFVRRYGSGAVLTFEPEAQRALAAFEWPGNVRQLENEVRRLLVLSDGLVTRDQLSPELQAVELSAVPDTLEVRARVDALERQLVEAALGRTDGNQTRAAELLGLSRFGLQKMMKRLEIGGSGRRSPGALQKSR